ncbi:PaaI family thioesterase [Nitratifractor salsuginis]|uniref:Thioesterase superfamily protein n=1 Tax=Nitratifractor salsuginis (strain DSM 16511 / JCM 12458 / E9I37-1) TaxID=749222 RepID=E6X073_NITSE|nr:hotdog domain-containing protein [Nitratifractor salsuginis]ADV45662.1 thioesterase superfamily protein [Nitratifractor salsuginis DSM 16511]
MSLKTHLAIDEDLCGRVTRHEKGYAEVWLHTSERMKADDRGLIHGGFLFSAADYAAMAAVNDPNVVLGAAEVKFLAPVRKGQSIRFVARIGESSGKRRRVEVSGEAEGRRVFEGAFQAFVLPRHVLEG